jgi:A/G-specific adenine glycosylase
MLTDSPTRTARTQRARPAPEPRVPRDLVRRLLEWFLDNPRPLPWRRTLDPYAVWVSEIMLQQTQVKTVQPYWERWMRELPTLDALARAKPARVLKLWEGLGYYRRARHLQRAALAIVRQLRGDFPRHWDKVLALPGVGRYTAGAICSIAFNQPAPVLDGNVMRVLTRLFGLHGPPRQPPLHARLWSLSEALVRQAAPLRLADFSQRWRRVGLRFAGTCSALNQALMEFGATVCRPQTPTCAECPLRRHCLAYRHGEVDRLPTMGRRAPSTARQVAAFVVKRGEALLARRRPAGVVNAGLWELPNVEVNGRDCDPRHAAWEALGWHPPRVDFLAKVTHAITRFRITLRAFEVEADHRPLRLGQRDRWVRPEEAGRLAFVSAHRRVLERVWNVRAP